MCFWWGGADRDDHWAGEDDDLEYFISESAEIIGVTGQVDPDKCVGHACAVACLCCVGAPSVRGAALTRVATSPTCRCTHRRSPKELLEYIFRRLVDFKKFDQGGGVEDVPGNNQAEELAKIGNSVGVSAGAGGAGAGAGVAGTGGVM